MDFYGMDEAQADKAVEKYRERFRDTGIFENKVYDGIPAMLRLLQSKGMHLAVASSKPTVFVERILEHFHLDKYFEVVVGSELDGSRVSKDEVVQEALNRLFHYKPIQRSIPLEGFCFLLSNRLVRKQSSRNIWHRRPESRLNRLQRTRCQRQPPQEWKCRRCW